MSDEVLKLLEDERPNTRWPTIAFQFSPQTKLGLRTEKEVRKTDFWISSPELRSLHSTLHIMKLLSIGLDEKIQKMEKLKYFFYITLRLCELAGFLSLIGDSKSGVSNFLTFVLDLPFSHEIFLSRLDPYRLHNSDVTDYSIVGIYDPLVGYRRLIRVSWSDEHRFEHAEGLLRKIVEKITLGRQRDGDLEHKAQELLAINPLEGNVPSIILEIEELAKNMNTRTIDPRTFSDLAIAYYNMKMRQ